MAKASKARYRAGRARCPSCGRVISYYVPYRGDGSVDVYRQHKDPETGERCEGSKQEVASADILSEPVGWKRGWGPL